MAHTIDLNNRNPQGTWTAEFDCYAYGRTLTPKQRHLFFRIGAEIQSNIARRAQYLPDVHRCHDYARWVLEQTNWKSLKAARALFSLSQQHGYFLF